MPSALSTVKARADVREAKSAQAVLAATADKVAAFRAALSLDPRDRPRNNAPCRPSVSDRR